jgi:hypothetical protein
MKFGVREICEVVLKAKATQKVGNKIFYANEPVCYFDTLKTSSMEGAATTVYAQGGTGNARLIAWEGERTVTFTMEDALISPEGFMILSGAGLIDASENNKIYQHVTENIDASVAAGNVVLDSDTGDIIIYVSKLPYLPEGSAEHFAYVMFKKNDEIITEPYIPVHEPLTEEAGKGYPLRVSATATVAARADKAVHPFETALPALTDFDSVLVDYYVEKTSNAQQIDITPDKFGGNYYLEASTLFRDTNGVDMPAEFIIPNCKIQSNFTFTMASTGDPSTFTFTMDAFPDYTRFNHGKKVLAAIQIIKEGGAQEVSRISTVHAKADEALF